jgi:hypothetical protein
MCVLRMSPEVLNTEFCCLQGCDSRFAPGGALCQTMCYVPEGSRHCRSYDRLSRVLAVHLSTPNTHIIPREKQ